ncbi:putative quinol monooxygenase [Frankia umida]|nr:putative quinol monooxygenase [Frankia umida]
MRAPYPQDMIFIVVRWPVKPEFADQWLDIVADFTASTQAESGNLFFDWSRSTEDPTTYTLVEAFADQDAGVAHVNSGHFRAAIDKLPDYVSGTPEIINVTIPDATGWSEMAEVRPRP